MSPTDYIKELNQQLNAIKDLILLDERIPEDVKQRVKDIAQS